MSDRKDHELTGNLGRVYKAVLHSMKGIRAVEIAERLNIDRTTVHSHLSSLRLMGRVESEQGAWCAITREQTGEPLEKEIEIELPIPKDQLLTTALLEIFSKDCERANFPRTGEIYRTLLEKLRETRTIKIKGKNVDDLDLEKLQTLILQMNKKSSKFDIKGLLRTLRRPRENKNAPAKTSNKKAESSSA